ncbi:MAG: rhodanese-like domain-containing protein, partial [Alphaproteobacteria bacterium]
MPRPVSAPEVARMLADGREIAFIDVREITEFGTAHPLLAANLPLSRLELSIPCAVPRLATRVVLLDGGGGEADLAANRLAELGYADVGVLDGGAPAWAAAGLALFPEIEVPAKGFGAFARAYGRTNFIESRELAQWLEGGLERGENCIV